MSTTQRPGAVYAPPTSTAFDPTGPLPTGPVLLEASAGTGKTYAIATLVLRLVAEEGLGIHEILVVTFTEAATTELRDRVRRRLRDALAVAERARRTGTYPADAPPDAATRHVVTIALRDGTLDVAIDRLRRALERFDDAAIATIHGFCARVLRERAFECGAELDGELLTDVDALCDELARDFWARTSAAHPLDAVRALDAACGYATLRDVVGRALRHADAPCLPACVDDRADGADDAGLGDPALDAALAVRRRAARTLADSWLGETGESAGACLEEAILTKQLSGTTWKIGEKGNNLETRSRAVSAGATGRPECDPAPDALAYFHPDRLRKATNKAGTTPAHALFDEVAALAEADTALEAALGDAVLRLKHACARWARREAARRKRARRQHGYDDLLRLVRDALRRGGADGALARALRTGFRAALIDEFQDTDAVQWEIFHTAFGDPAHRLVLIGDPKQSIYGFRGADLRAYLAAREAAGRVGRLDTNHRTDRALVDALHALVDGPPLPFAESGIRWHPVGARHDAPRLVGAGAPLRVRFLARDGVLAPRGTKRVPAKEQAQRHLPSWVAADVVRFLSSGATIADREGAPPRAVRPGDAAVLVRSHRQARAIQAALRRAGVPAVIHGAESVFASAEAGELAAVLAAVLEPADARLLRAALATDLLGIPAARALAAWRPAAGDAMPNGSIDAPPVGM